jgi:hypothetical protein
MKKSIMGHAALLLVGCYDPASAENAAPDQEPTAPALSAPKLSGTTAVRSPGSAIDAPTSGVQICALDVDGSACAWSGEDGHYSLGPLAPGSLARLRYAKPGLLSMVVDYDLPESSQLADVFLLPEAVAGEALASPGIVVAVQKITYDGASPLEGARVRTAGTPPFVYASARNQLDRTLEATTETGWAAAFGVKPGRYTLEVSYSDPAVRCGSPTTRPGAFDGTIVVEPVAGSLAMVTVYCFQMR